MEIANTARTYATIKVIYVDYKVFFTSDSARHGVSLATINPSYHSEQVFLKLKINEGSFLDVNRIEILKTNHCLTKIDAPFPIDQMLSDSMIGDLDEDSTETIKTHHMIYLDSDGTFRWIEIGHSGVSDCLPLVSSCMLSTLGHWTLQLSNGFQNIKNLAFQIGIHPM